LRRCRVEAEPALPLEAEEEKHRLAAGVDGKHPVRPGSCVTINQSDGRAALPALLRRGWNQGRRAKLPRRAPGAIHTEPLQRVTNPRHGRGTIAREGLDDSAILEAVRKKECDVATKFDEKPRGSFATDVPEGLPARSHHVVARDGENGLEVLRVPLEGKGQVLPVFSVGWAARGYLFAEAPGGGWYVRACIPGELASLLIGLCAGVGWVALDPRPGRCGGEAANVMPRKHFLDYLLCSRAPSFLRRWGFETIGGVVHELEYGRENDR
jgi:hypothetical protein